MSDLCPIHKCSYIQCDCQDSPYTHPSAPASSREARELAERVFRYIENRYRHRLTEEIITGVEQEIALALQQAEAATIEAAAQHVSNGKIIFRTPIGELSNKGKLTQGFLDEVADSIRSLSPHPHPCRAGEAGGSAMVGCCPPTLRYSIRSVSLDT